MLHHANRRAKHRVRIPGGPCSAFPTHDNFVATVRVPQRRAQRRGSRVRNPLFYPLRYGGGRGSNRGPRGLGAGAFLTPELDGPFVGRALIAVRFIQSPFARGSPLDHVEPHHQHPADRDDRDRRRHCRDARDRRARRPPRSARRARITDSVRLPGTPISGPTTITQPGHYYVTRDITAAPGSTWAIMIDADDVSIDLGGFTLSGDDTIGSAGLFVQASRQRISISNGTVRDFAAGV